MERFCLNIRVLWNTVFLPESSGQEGVTTSHYCDSMWLRIGGGSMTTEDMLTATRG